MENQVLREAIIRTLAFHASWSYAPTYIQLLLSLDYGVNESQDTRVSKLNLEDVLKVLVQEDLVVKQQGRFALNRFSYLMEQGKEKEIYNSRKMRKAKRVVWYLKKIPWIKSVCLCNTTALGQSKETSDLDFFIITKPGYIWITRFFAALPFVIFKMRPEDPGIKDPVCLSFFVTQNGLDLSKLMLEDDPYFRYWFLFLLPLYDDGVLAELWFANVNILKRHANAIPWISLDKTAGDKSNSQESKSSNEEISFLEKKFKIIQQNRLPSQINKQANQSTDVVISDNVLKFHTTDARRPIRDSYYKICNEFNVQP
ncbi:hypothetical protein KKG46_03590 [Patescibacteria group bacterium]|nr:hypothetical protein [Patescibacteria group bacterium]